MAAEAEVAAVAGLLVDLVFEALGLQRQVRNAKVGEASITLNYTTVPSLLFLTLAQVLVARFLRTKGPEMLRMLNHLHPRVTGTVRPRRRSRPSARRSGSGQRRASR